jgi:membrane protein
MKAAVKSLIEFISSLRQFVVEDIWRLDFRRLSPIKAFFLRHARIVLIVAKRFIQDRLLVRAAALVYATLMSIVPLLAVMFSLLKGFGYHNELEPFLSRLLAPLGEQAVQKIVPPIVNFVGNADVTALGAVGFMIFLLSSISIINNMERSFNDVWRVQKSRSLHRRIGEYLSVLILGPALALVVIAATTSLQNYALMRTIREIPVIEIFANSISPFLASWIVFYFLLVFIPNTKVKIRSALYGALIAGTLWQLMNSVFARFIVISYQSGTKGALYASFAVFPLFLVWVYFSWAVVLLGAEFTHVHQNLRQTTWEEQAKPISRRMEESIAIKIMLLISQKFHKNEKAPTQSDLSESLQIPGYAVDHVLSRLLELELVNVIDQEEVRYAPAKSLDTLSLREIMEKLRTYGTAESKADKDDAISRLVDEIQDKYDKALKKAFADTSIRDLLGRIDKG